jgi:hypothetical protein
VWFAGPVGWADFGKGRVPAGVAERLGAPVLDARTLPSLVKQSEPPLQAHVFAKLNKDKAVLGFKKVVEQFGPAWDLVRPHLGFARSDPPPHPIVNAVAGDVGVRVDDSGWIVSQAVQEPERFRLIREARGLSREAASAQATEMDRHHPVTASALRAYEETGAVPAVERFFSRLDAAYAADGHFGLDFVHDSRSRYPRDGIRFPTYWQGPIWLQIRGTGEDTSGLVDLTWGPWHRSQYVLAGTVLTTRKASEKMPPLVCELPAGWHVRAGVGAIPAGLDINHGWYPKDIGAAWGLITSHIKRLVHINRSAAVTDPFPT